MYIVEFKGVKFHESLNLDKGLKAKNILYPKHILYRFGVCIIAYIYFSFFLNLT